MEHKTKRKITNHRMEFGHPKQLNKDAMLLLFTSALFTIAVALSDTFVNVYLWKLKKDYLMIGWFNFYQYIAIGVAFVLAGLLAKKYDRVILLRAGVSVLTIFYLSVLFLGDRSTDYYVLLGIIVGIGEALYWYAFNILYFEITERDNRDTFNGWNGLLTSVGGIIAPFISGWFLSKKVGVTGYKTIFFISLIIFVAAVILSFFFYKRKSHGHYQIGKVFKETTEKTNWRYITLGMVAQGGREGVIIFLIGLLIYISTNNEFSLGSYAMIISAVASVTYFIVGKFMKEKWRNKAMFIGTIMMAIAVVPLFINISYTTLLIYGVVTSIFAPLYFIPLTSIVFDAIGESDETAKLRSEYVVLRETGLNIGRIVITIIFILLLKGVGPDYLKYLLLVSGSLQILAWVSIRNVKKKVDA